MSSRAQRLKNKTDFKIKGKTLVLKKQFNWNDETNTTKGKKQWRYSYLEQVFSTPARLAFWARRFFVDACAICWRAFSSSPVLYPLDTSSSPPPSVVRTKNVSRHRPVWEPPIYSTLKCTLTTNALINITIRIPPACSERQVCRAPPVAVHHPPRISPSSWLIFTQMQKMSQ